MTAMTEDKEKKKEGAFDPGCVTDIYEAITNHNLALRAFAELLNKSDLTAFTCEKLGDLKWGLGQIIELYLSHQERILSEYVDQYHKSDIWFVKRAEGLINMVEHGAFTSREVSANHLREAISELDIVINRNGDLQGKAQQLKGVCLEYIQQLTNKIHGAMKHPS